MIERSDEHKCRINNTCLRWDSIYWNGIRIASWYSMIKYSTNWKVTWSKLINSPRGEPGLYSSFQLTMSCIGRGAISKCFIQFVGFSSMQTFKWRMCYITCLIAFVSLCKAAVSSAGTQGVPISARVLHQPLAESGRPAAPYASLPDEVKSSIFLHRKCFLCFICVKYNIIIVSCVSISKDYSITASNKSVVLFLFSNHETWWFSLYSHCTIVLWALG